MWWVAYLTLPGNGDAEVAEAQRTAKETVFRNF